MEIRRLLICFSFCLFAVSSAAFGQNSSAVLVRGNSWVTGFPGVGENAFRCFFGEYRIINGDTPSGSGERDARESVFSVYVCWESLIFPEETWRPRQGTACLQRRDGEALLIALPALRDEGSGTVMFRFSGPEIDESRLNSLIRVWTDRYRYFFSLIKTVSDTSFPAVVNF